MSLAIQMEWTHHFQKFLSDIIYLCYLEHQGKICDKLLSVNTTKSVQAKIKLKFMD